ncbi:MAG TPA: class I SAM-dependent methyltransferase [Vicinamibacterales bacterium]|nr:class I SAM-dependent methyltransferase [Vicinamibacterales bacterium]
MDAAWDATERQMLSALPAAKPGQIALDVGCGEVHQRFRAGLTRLGYLPVGVDIAGSAPDALADAHRLPFADASLDVIMTSAVFEHLKHPHLAMSEMARVLRPGGRILGSIAFGEPFHISYFHHSPLAVFEILDSSDLDATVFVLSDRYSAFYAHLEMGFAGQRIPKSIHGIIARAVREVAVFPARVKSIVQRSPQHLRLARSAFARSHTASVGFIAHRRSDAA